MNAHKLDETIIEFETEVNKLKSVNESYEKLEETAKEIGSILEISNKNNAGIYQVNQDVDNLIIEFKNTQKNISTNIAHMNSLFEEKLDTFKESNKESYLELSKFHSSELDILRKANRESYLELEKLLNSKLELIQSNIEVEIRNGNQKLDDKLESHLDIKFIKFNESMNVKLTSLENSLTKQNNIMTAFIILVLLAAMIYFNIISQ